MFKAFGEELTSEERAKMDQLAAALRAKAETDSKRQKTLYICMFSGWFVGGLLAMAIF